MTLLNDPTPATVAEPFDWIDAPDGKLYELIDGKPVEKRVSMLSMWVATQIAYLLKIFVEARQSGFVMVEQPVLGIWGRPRHGRRPDVCYVSKSSLPAIPPVGEVEVTPDLVVEVISTHDQGIDIETKIQEYLAAGVKVVWAVYPPLKMVRVHQADGVIRMLNITGVLDGASALPGFTCPVADLFPKA